MFVTAATPAGTMGRLSTTECTYLPTYLAHTHACINACFACVSFSLTLALLSSGR